MAKSLAGLSDADILSVATQTLNAMTSNPSAYGTTAAELSILDTAISDAQTAVNDQIAKTAAAKASTSVKETKISAVIAQLRTRRDVAKAHGASDALMEATNLPHGATEPTPPNATVPVLTVNTSRRLQHDLAWAEATTPDSRKRPRGTMGAEIWRKIDGPPPKDVSECTFVAIDSSSPHTVDYTGDDVGKMVHYMARWKMRGGETLAFGETVSATVTG